MTAIDHTVDRAGPWPSFTVGTRAIEVVPLTATSAPSCATSAWPRPPATTTLFAELKALLLQHKVLFFRDQDITRAEHVALAERFGPLEDHPVAGSDPDHPGLVRIYKDLDSPPEHYENAFHCDATWREVPPLGSVLRCVEGPAGRRRHDLGRTWPRPTAGCPSTSRRRSPACGRGTASRPASARRCRRSSGSRLHARFPDAEHPVVRTHPETGEKVLFVNAFTTHFTNFHTPENVRFGFDYAPGASDC